MIRYPILFFLFLNYSCSSFSRNPSYSALQENPRSLFKMAVYLEELKKITESSSILELETLTYSDGFPVVLVTSKSDDNKEKPHIFLNAGTHGNEPLGVDVVLRFLEIYARTPKLQNLFSLCAIPALNPWGLTHFKRRNSKNIDLNREFKTDATSKLILSLQERLSGQDYAAVIDLHGAPKKKYFFTIVNSKNDVAAARTMAKLPSEELLFSRDGKYPGKRGSYSMIAPGVAISKNQGTLKSWGNHFLKAPLSYTMEYPGKREANHTKKLYLEILTSLIFEILQIQGKQEPR